MLVLKREKSGSLGKIIVRGLVCVWGTERKDSFRFCSEESLHLGREPNMVD